MREIWKPIVSTSGARVYALAAQFVLLVLTARLLGPEGRGVIATVTTWVAFFGTIGYLSLGQVALHRAAESGGRPWLPSTLGSLLAIATVLSVVGWGIAAASYGISGGAVFGDLSKPVLVLGFAALPFFIWEHYGSALLTAIDRLGLYNRAQVVGRTAGLVLVVVLLIGLGGGITGVLVALLVSQMIVAGAGIQALWSQAGGPIRVDLDTVGALLRGGVRLHLNAVGTFLVTSADILMIQHFRGIEETGHYQLAVQLMSIMLVVPQAACLVLYGHVARLGSDAAWIHNRRVLAVLTPVVIGFAGAAAVLSPWVIPLVMGDAFEPAVPVFRLLLLALIGQTFSVLMAPQWIGRGLFVQASALSLGVGLSNLGANLVLIPRYGMYGAAYATIGTYGIGVFCNILLALWIERKVRRDAAEDLGHAADIQPPAVHR